MFRSAALAALLAASAVVAAPVPKDLKKKEVSLDGTWEVVEWHSGGNKINNGTTIRWVIDGQSLSIERANKGGAIMAKAVNVSYSLVKPDGGAANALDYTITYANGGPAPRVMPGVVEMDGDTLKFCWAMAGTTERPKDCTPAAGNTLYVFKRVETK